MPGSAGGARAAGRRLPAVHGGRGGGPAAAPAPAARRRCGRRPAGRRRRGRELVAVHQRPDEVRGAVRGLQPAAPPAHRGGEPAPARRGGGLRARPRGAAVGDRRGGAAAGARRRRGAAVRRPLGPGRPARARGARGRVRGLCDGVDAADDEGAEAPLARCVPGLAHRQGGRPAALRAHGPAKDAEEASHEEARRCRRAAGLHEGAEAGAAPAPAGGVPPPGAAAAAAGAAALRAPHEPARGRAAALRRRPRPGLGARRRARPEGRVPCRAAPRARMRWRPGH
mmetsp:Transcript_153/g.396  ORF Transcript_153/g.396 Transcript_153/m.396 type:complete len:283 (-) Transcript_153:101-949(-)